MQTIIYWTKRRWLQSNRVIDIHLQLDYKNLTPNLMKNNKFLVSAMVASSCFLAVPAFSQTDESSESASGDTTEQPATTENSDPNAVYNERVTIDESSSETTPAASESSSASVQSDRKERVRIYSGKHDGNNVIYDPKN